MRYLIVILLVVLLVVIDQFRFNGHYGAQLSLMMQRAINYVVR